MADGKESFLEVGINIKKQKINSVSYTREIFKKFVKNKIKPNFRLIKASLVVITVASLALWSSGENINTIKKVLTSLFKNAESIAIISAGFIFILEISERQKRDQYEAWQVINSAISQSGSGGRIQALEDLNRDGVALEGVSAPGADLSGINLVNANLARADFARTQLDKANLRGANLKGANLEGANLEGANLEGANLEGANLGGANLYIANLQGACFVNATLQAAYLVGTNLQKTNLTCANFGMANLAHANCGDAFLWFTSFHKADLAHTDLSKIKWIEELDLDEAYLCNTLLPDSLKIDPNRDCSELEDDIPTSPNVW